MVALKALLLATAVTAAPEPIPGLTAGLHKIAQNVSGTYNCSVSIAFKNAQGEASAAFGTTDFSSGKQATTADRYAFGSCTKMLTGSSILRLVSEGRFGLDDKAAPLVDPFLAKMAATDPKQDFKSMEDLWGANATTVTVRELLAMTAGVPDFDTANPCYTPGCVPQDDLRKALYDQPDHGYSPVELMSVDWVRGADKWQECKPFRPGMKEFCYSSTNFMLLGMILASDAGVSSWEEFDQAEFLPKEVQTELSFAKSGTPKDNGVVHGYDRTAYNMPDGQLNDHDNFEVAGVFSGWSASDVVTTASGIAALTWEIYGPNHSVAPKEYADMMIPNASDIYGLATHQLSSRTGQKGDYGVGYGHLGATYGYQSVTAYFPKLDFVLTVATNLETDSQIQPAHAMCFAYNKAASLMLGQDIQCTYQGGSYYSGGCKCDPIQEEAVVV